MPPRQADSTEEEKEPVKVNKWDSNAVKNALDDCVKKIATEDYGYSERTRLMNERLVISVTAVGFALFALLWDWLHPFPQSRPVLIVCVLSYFALMGVLQMFQWYRERGIFCQAVDEDPTGTKPDAHWNLISKIKKFDDMYTLTLEVQRGPSCRQTTIVKSVSSWIDEEGNIVNEVIKSDVHKMHDSIADEKKTK